MSSDPMHLPVVLHTRRAVLRDGALVVVGLGIGCGAKLPPAADDSAETTVPPPDTAADGTADPCAVVPEVGAPGWMPVMLEDHPILAEVGGSVTLDLDGLSLILAQPSEGCFVALSRVCTHQGCTVEYRDGRFICPCHGAAFSIDGSVQAGPTPIPLPSYPAAEDERIVWVHTG